MSDLEVNTAALRAYAANLDGLHGAFDAVAEYATQAGCDKSGFTGLLTLLHPAVDLVDSLFGETVEFGHDKLKSLSEGINKVADRYDKDDAARGDIFTRIINDLDDTTTDVA